MIRPSIDGMPAACERRGPLAEHRGRAVIAGVDRRIAVAADDQIAVQHAVRDRAAAFRASS